MFSKYKYVYAVYKEGSFTKAAESLFITQPSLSVAIRNTEQKLGGAIFERSGTGVKLTDIGKEYINATEKLLSVEKDFDRRLSDINALEFGSISVGGTNYMSSYVLPRIINRFSDLHPKIKVDLVEAHSAELCEMIN